MGEKTAINVLVTGGEASAGPPLGPALGPLGVNVLGIVNEINRQTADFKGMRVPVKVEVDKETKQFVISVGTPTTSALIAKESGIPKGSAKPNLDFMGELTVDKVIGIAKSKMAGSYAANTRSAVKEVVGSCVSMGVKIEGKDAREFMKEIDAGKWDSKFA
ncbi:MAG: 50S ribosomal protein L11 [Nitrososphaerota archaeon]|nr:50S ribosomal protein L11 [Nitrososphaerota archaeon]MDG7024062.1 50S ribosomal protein L11 [Nitrososphaerota archaeon]